MRKFFITLLLFLAPVAACADALDGLDGYIEQALKDWNVPGLAIAVVKDNRVIYSKGFGVRELGNPAKVNDKTLFQIGSLTKAVTGTAFAILVDEGKLHWDDRVIDHLPWFRLKDPSLTEQITLRDLLSHRTGLRDAWYLYYAPMDTRETIRRMRLLDNYADFRQDAEYSNLMYAVAGEVIASVSGMSWHDFVKSRVLKPLGMKNSATSAYDFWDRKYVTSVFLGAAPAGQVSAKNANVPNVAMPHHQWGDQKITRVAWQYYDNAAAAGTVVSNVTDMARWLRFHLNEGMLDDTRLISPVRARELHSPQMILPSTWAFPTIDAMPPKPLSYTFGWIRSDHRGAAMLSHGGGIIGFPAHIAMIPEHNMGIVVLANGTNSKYTMHRQISFHIFDRLRGLPAHDWRATYREAAEKVKLAEDQYEQTLQKSRLKNTKPTLALEKYAGTYEDKLVGPVKVEVEDGKLHIFVPGKGMFSGIMEHWHNDMFRLNWQGVFSGFKSFVEFDIGAYGTITQMKAEHIGDFTPVPAELRTGHAD